MSIQLERSKKHWWNGFYGGKIRRFTMGEMICDDALKFLRSLNDQCADIIFLDPPFNLGKKYGRSDGKADRLSEEAYFAYISSVLLRSKDVLKPGGSLYLYHVPRWAIRFATVLNQEGLTFRHWIAICMKNGFPRGPFLYPAHYALLLFTKGQPAHFTRPKLSIQLCRSCGDTVKDYGGYRALIQDGLNLSDFWEDISPVRHRKYKTRESNELPIKMLDRIVTISGTPGGLLVDPFAGSGTSLLAAQKAKLFFVGCDKEEQFLDVVEKRLSLHKSLLSTKGL